MGLKATSLVKHNYQHQSVKAQQHVDFGTFMLQVITLDVLSGQANLASLESGLSQVGLFWHRLTSKWLESSMINRPSKSGCCPGGKLSYPQKALCASSTPLPTESAPQPTQPDVTSQAHNCTTVPL